MPKRTKDHHSWVVDELKNPLLAVNYLKAAIDDSREMFLIALHNVAEAYKIAKVAEEAGVSRESLYRTLSKKGNPRLATLNAILKVIGLRISVEVIQPVRTSGGTAPIPGEKEQAGQEPDLNLGEQDLGIRKLLACQYQSQKALDPEYYARH